MPWPQAALHTQFPGGAQPGDGVFDGFFASQVSSIADYAKQQELNAAAGAALLDRIGPAVLLTHSQAGNFGGLMRRWRPAEPARRLVNLAGIPVVILQGEASHHAPYDHCTSQWLAQAGVANTFIRLADLGIRGNGHMMMFERNKAVIAEVIAAWLDSEVR
jgi:pimeloyl-ACP methyl ester carboxylesterase